ncbi:cation diffusion facilitator family transporter [Coriobacterium glomerans PW2]|uniref:Cation diffusion facilitator family transporter n=1 Tax=Coriobacterium glomerans (strain ATCC 49209 / DSM 20642 / JCM 10262 / PW2) TaxID=700015 RepID=F2N8G1_CORGP|nr:cation diffusion facilitator family transporter [Coriobacterium glomerans]AEB07344.1 cation diffusion facilitator family transporter [Coriobacterium glomerans PW2]
MRIGAHSAHERFSRIRHALGIILVLNLMVAVAKIWYGSITGAVSVRADGIASLFDSVSNLVGIIGLALAARPADLDHPYGHQKFETYASAGIGIMLLGAAYSVGSEAVGSLVFATAEPQVNAGSFAVMVITLAVNLFVVVFERNRARALRSELLEADSFHTLADVLVTLSVILGLVFVRAGWPIADPIVSILVAVMILKSAYEVFRQASATLSDKARISVREVKSVVNSVPGAINCHNVRTRGTEGEVYMDLHIMVEPSMSIAHAHEVAGLVERAIAESFPQVVDTVVHVEPDTPEERFQAAMDDSDIS